MATLGRVLKRATVWIRDAFLDLWQFVFAWLVLLFLIGLAGYFVFLMLDSWYGISDFVFR